MKKLWKLIGAALAGINVAACSSSGITREDKENLSKTASQAEKWLKEKYSRDFRIEDAGFAYSDGLFGITYYTDAMRFETADGVHIIYEEERFLDDYEGTMISEELTDHFRERMSDTGYDVIWSSEPVFGTYYICEQNYTGMFSTKWNGNAEDFLAQEKGNYTINRVQVGLSQGTRASSLDKQIACEGPGAFTREGMEWQDASKAVTEVLTEFGEPTFTVFVSFVHEDLLHDTYLRTGDQNCEHVTKVFGGNTGIVECCQNRYYLGHNLYLSCDEFNFELNEDDVIIKETDMSLRDLEGLLNGVTFKEPYEHYTVLELTISERAKDVIRSKDSLNFFGMNLRGSAEQKVQIVNLERNEIRPTGWSYRPDTANLLYLYEKPTYLVINCRN